VPVRDAVAAEPVPVPAPVPEIVPVPAVVVRRRSPAVVQPMLPIAIPVISG
jgi:hypothetical protein